MLRTLIMEDFRAFRSRTVDLEDAACVIVGQNSSGKSSIRDALLFLTLDDASLRLSDLIRRLDVDGGSDCGAVAAANSASVESSAPTMARVTGRFDASGGAAVWLRREVSKGANASVSEAVAAAAAGSPVGRCVCAFWVALGNESWQPVSEACYSAWVRGTLRWAPLAPSALVEGDGALAPPQFGLLGELAPERLLRSLGDLLDRARRRQLDEQEAPSTLLKRRRAPTRPGAPPVGDGARMEAWVARRLDEVYRELTREPLDESMTEWGDGGQACLRRSEGGDGGGLTILTSRQRGGAAVGRGVPLKAMSDGDRDVCSLALLVTMSGLAAGCREELPPFVLLDEPDARLDKGRARALWRYLSGSLAGAAAGEGRQCLLFSLNNHLAFGAPAPGVLAGGGDDGPGGGGAGGRGGGGCAAGGRVLHL